MPSTVLDLFTAVKRASCRYGARCGTVAPTTNCDGLVAEEATEYYGQWYAQGQFGVDMAAASACLRALETASCGAAANGSSRGGSFLTAAECEPFFGGETVTSSGATFSMRYPMLLQGRVALGGACRNSVECASHGFCDLTTSCPGRCAGSAGPGPVAAPTPCRADLQLREGNNASGPFRVCLAAPATGQNCWVPNCTSGGARSIVPEARGAKVRRLPRTTTGACR